MSTKRALNKSLFSNINISTNSCIFVTNIYASMPPTTFCVFVMHTYICMCVWMWVLRKMSTQHGSIHTRSKRLCNINSDAHVLTHTRASVKVLHRVKAIIVTRRPLSSTWLLCYCYYLVMFKFQFKCLFLLFYAINTHKYHHSQGVCIITSNKHTLNCSAPATESTDRCNSMHAVDASVTKSSYLLPFTSKPTNYTYRHN